MNTSLVILSVLLICIGLYRLVSVLVKRFSRAYEEGYVDVTTQYKRAEISEQFSVNSSQDDFSRVISQYEEITKSVATDNPILIGTYMFLSQAYEKVGDFQASLQAINNAIAVLKKVNKSKVYIVQALISKALLLDRNGRREESISIWQSLLDEFPNLNEMINRRAEKEGIKI